MKYQSQGKNRVRGRKQVHVGEPPRYKYVIPVLLCVYMLLAQFVTGMSGKSILLMVAVVGMIAWAIGEKIFPDYVFQATRLPMKRWRFIPLAIFILMAVLSQMFASDYSNSIFTSESDSLWMLCGYILLFYISYQSMALEKSLQVVKLGITIVVIAVVLLSFLEFFDAPIARLWIGQIEDLAERNRVVLTFGNSNYYGAFCCMLLPFVMEFGIRAVTRTKKLLFILLNSLLMVCVLMSKSTTAVYLMLAVVFAILLYEHRLIRKQLGGCLCQVGVFIVLILIVNGLSGGTLFDLVRVGAGNTDAFTEEQVLYEVEDIQLEGSCLVIKGEDTSFVIEYDDGLVFYNEEKQLLDIKTQEDIITFTEQPYDAITVGVSYNQNLGLLYLEVDTGYKDTIDFCLKEGIFQGVGADGSPVEDISGARYGEEWYHLFTGRGYIWIRTMDMLDEVILLGKGCGNFVHTFKQYDYVGLLKSQGTQNIIIDRPHNMFLQYCVEIGVIGAIALFIFIAYILFGWIYKNIKNGKEENAMSIASFFAIVVFMIFSVLNDSVISITPYLWIFLGTNLAYQIKNDQ